MLRAKLLVATLPALVLSATLGQLAAQEPGAMKYYVLAKGTKAISCKITKGVEIAEGSELWTGVHMAVDIVGEISEPIKTGIALLNVRLIAINSRTTQERPGDPLFVTVEVTPAQAEVLSLMVKHEMKLGLRLHVKEKPKP